MYIYYYVNYIIMSLLTVIYALFPETITMTDPGFIEFLVLHQEEWHDIITYDPAFRSLAKDDNLCSVHCACNIPTELMLRHSAIYGLNGK